MDQQALLAVYVLSMAAGAALFAVWARDPKGVHREEYLVAIAIPVWSGLIYLMMAIGLGTADGGDRVIHWGRYLDWIVTTPLLLVALFLTATHRLRERPYTLLAAVVAADVVMIATGAIGDFAPEGARLMFFAIGVGALLVVLGLTWGPMRALAYSQGEDLGRVYVIVLSYLTACWIGYPLIWILGPSGVGAIGPWLETLLFVLLPIASKVGFSILDLSLLRRLSPTKAHNPAAQAR